MAKKYNSAKDVIEQFSERIIKEIKAGKLNASYRTSKDSISFYLNDIVLSQLPVMTLRLSDHNLNMQNYTYPDNTLPHLTKNTSIQFREPNSPKKKFNNKVKVREKDKDKILPFTVTDYKYKFISLDDSDIELIWSSVVKLLFNSSVTEYEDPLKDDNNKKADVKSKTARIIITPDGKAKWSCEAERNYFMRYLLGDSVAINQQNDIINENHNAQQHIRKRLLYESIMYDIAKIVKRRLIEYNND